MFPADGHLEGEEVAEDVEAVAAEGGGEDGEGGAEEEEGGERGEAEEAGGGEREREVLQEEGVEVGEPGIAVRVDVEVEVVEDVGRGEYREYLDEREYGCKCLNNSINTIFISTTETPAATHPRRPRKPQHIPLKEIPRAHLLLRARGRVGRGHGQVRRRRRRPQQRDLQSRRVIVHHIDDGVALGLGLGPQGRYSEAEVWAKTLRRSLICSTRLNLKP